jgi:FkbM family methyltransferase
MKLRTLFSKILRRTPLSYFPVTVRKGPAKGTRWTLLPFSYNWRHGGEKDVQSGLRLAGDLQDRVCWDFGAHFGIHTVGMARLVGEHGEVASFEPDQVAFRRLEYHVRTNRLSNVRLFQAAVSDHAGSERLIVSENLGSSCSHFRYEDEPEPKSEQTAVVSTVVPDDLVSAGTIRLPDVIKVDVQGHGAKALGGSLKSIQRKRPIIIFSNHSPWELADTRRLLQPLGYRLRTPEGTAVDWEWLSSYGTAILVSG